MDRRKYLGLLSGTLALSGCSGTDADNPRPQPETNDTPPSVGEFSFPEGLSESGIEDPLAIAKATQNLLSESNYSSIQRREVESAEQPSLEQREYIGDVKNQKAIHREISPYTRNDQEGVAVVDAYLSDTSGVIRNEWSGEFEDETSYERFKADSFGEHHQAPGFLGNITMEQITNLLSISDGWKPVETDFRLGKTIIIYKATGTPKQGDMVTYTGGTAMIDTTGILHEITLPFEGVEDDAFSGVSEYSLRALEEVSVSKPEWVETAREETTPSPSESE
jgi:hypothetical protein